MKLLVTFLSIIFIFLCSRASSEILTIGDNLEKAYKNSGGLNLLETVNSILFLPEGKIYLYSPSKSLEEAETIYCVSDNKYIIAISQQMGDHVEVLYDSIGDGYLDSRLDDFIIPFWVLVKSSEKAVDPNETSAIEVFNWYSTLFNADLDPYTSDELYKLLMKTNLIIVDRSYPNRDLIFALFYVFAMIDKGPEFALSAVKFLNNEYYERFGEHHPIVLFLLTNLLDKTGHPNETIDMAEYLVENWPDFIPGLYVSWELEADKEQKRIKYEKLKSNYSTHWIVTRMKE